MERLPALLGLAYAGCYLSHNPGAPEEALAEDPPRDCGGGVFAEPEVCGDGVDQDCDGIDPPCPADVCGGQRERHVVDVDLPDPAGCPWGEDDNGGTRDGYYRARTEQSTDLGLPAGFVPCGVAVEVPEQEIVFDDELLVTFADAVLLSSIRPEGLFEMTDGIPRYRWADLHGERLGDHAGNFCVDATSPCTLPDSEQRGSFGLDVSGELGLKLGEMAIAHGDAEITVITTGDDNVDDDCRHTPFTLRVIVDGVAP